MASGVFKDIKEFEKRLQLPDEFYNNLIAEDDWSFVIKLNALFEGACTHVLTKHLHTPEIDEAIAHLDLADTKCGKITLLKRLKVITPEQAKILRSLAVLRNSLVHNIANIKFSFEIYTKNLDANQRKAIIKEFGHGIKDTDLIMGKKKLDRGQFVCQNMKVSLWITAAEVLACLYLGIDQAKIRIRKIALEHNKQRALASNLARLLGAS